MSTAPTATRPHRGDAMPRSAPVALTDGANLPQRSRYHMLRMTRAPGGRRNPFAGLPHVPTPWAPALAQVRAALAASWAIPTSPRPAPVEDRERLAIAADLAERDRLA